MSEVLDLVSVDDEEDSQQSMNSITWLNMTGDITITWDESNRERLLGIVRKKMEEGYSFFTTPATPMARVTRRTRVTEKNIGKIPCLVISDKEFDRLTKSMDDPDIAELVLGEHADLAKQLPAEKGRKVSKERTITKRIKTAEDVVDGRSIAIRPVTGG